MGSAAFILEIAPLLFGILLFVIAFLLKRWKRSASKKTDSVLPGSWGVRLLILSLVLLGSFSLFVSTFFIVTG